MSTTEPKPILRLNSTMVRRATWILIALAGAVAAVVALTRTDDDPIGALLDQWPVVIAALLFYMTGMWIYGISWAVLFPPEDDRRLITLGFVISQPIKYLPGGIAQPIGQVTLAAQASKQPRRAVVSFPVHVLINVIAAITLAAPLLFIVDVPSWAVWMVIFVPITWAALDRRWMAGVLSMLGRLHERFRVSDTLPAQRSIAHAFGFALLAHGMMFLAFGVLIAPSIPEWSTLQLSTAFAVAWVVGYIAIPAPAGLGVREAALAVILSSVATTADVVRISAVHRIATLVVEMFLLLVALTGTRAAFRKRTEQQTGDVVPERPQQPDTEQGRPRN